MTRTYVRKTTRQSWTEESMIAAIEAVKQGLSCYHAGKLYSVPKRTLLRYMKKETTDGQLEICRMGWFHSVFTPEQEADLVKYIIQMSTNGFKLTNRNIRALAFQTAETLNIKHPFKRDQALAGKEWLRLFMTRHPELASSVRLKCSDKRNVQSFYLLLRRMYRKYSFTPDQIWTVDRTDFGTVQNSSRRTSVKKGRHPNIEISPDEKGSTATVIMAMSASGSFIPPTFVFPRVRMNDSLKTGAPENSLFLYESPESSNSENCSSWLEHFLQHVKPSAERPILLILDGQMSHMTHLNFLERAKDNFVQIIFIPPYSSHRLQPFVVTVMSSLRKNYSRAFKKFRKLNRRKKVTVQNIASLVREALVEAATVENAVKGFRATGIYPFDEKVLSVEEKDDHSEDHLSINDTEVKIEQIDDELTMEHNSSDTEHVDFDQKHELEDDPDISYELHEVDDSYNEQHLATNATETGQNVELQLDSATHFQIKIEEDVFGITAVDQSTLNMEQEESQSSELSSHTINHDKVSAPVIPTALTKVRTYTNKKAAKRIGQLKSSSAIQTSKCIEKKRPGKPSFDGVDDILCSSCGYVLCAAGNGNGWKRCFRCDLWFYEPYTESGSSSRKTCENVFPITAVDQSTLNMEQDESQSSELSLQTIKHDKVSTPVIPTVLRRVKTYTNKKAVKRFGQLKSSSTIQTSKCIEKKHPGKTSCDGVDDILCSSCGYVLCATGNRKGWKKCLRCDLWFYEPYTESGSSSRKTCEDVFKIIAIDQSTLNMEQDESRSSELSSHTIKHDKVSAPVIPIVLRRVKTYTNKKAVKRIGQLNQDPVVARHVSDWADKE